MIERETKTDEWLRDYGKHGYVSGCATAGFVALVGLGFLLYGLLHDSRDEKIVGVVGLAAALLAWLFAYVFRYVLVPRLIAFVERTGWGRRPENSN